MRYFTAVIAAAFLWLCTFPAFAATTSIVRGNVIVNGAPKAGVVVTVSGEGSQLRTTTDTSGNFSFPQVPFGHYQVTAHTEGLPDATQSIDVASDQVAVVNLQIASLKEIGHTQVTARGGAAGAPISQNAITRTTIAALPTNNSLNAVVQTMPGIVKFSYNEPVAHGFHGITYEIDGAPMPQATSSNFSEILDPKNLDSVEIFTGAFPAEYGGARQGAVVNILTNRPSDVTGAQGYVTMGGGNYGQMIGTYNQAFTVGATHVFFNANMQRTTRGIDAPTLQPIHDDSSQYDQFLRIVAPLGARSSLAADFSNQFAQFQIPINTDPNNPNDPVFNVPGTDDVQKEYDRFVSLNFTRTSADGNGIVQFIPWYRYTRIAYDGDLPKDVLGTTPDPVTGLPTPNVGLRENRVANYIGLRMSDFRATAHHAIKFGIDLSRENFTSDSTFAQLNMPNVSTSVAQPGSLIGIYAQDKWSPSRTLTVNYGLRYDHSTGFTSGNQLSPRIGINIAPDSKNVIHFYFGRLYAAPALEDVRQSCVVLQGCPTVPVYDLKPESDSYAEMGVAHDFNSRMSGYINLFRRVGWNVLDTTQLLNTPIFAVFNNANGRVEGMELRLQDRLLNGDSWFYSSTLSHAEAAGVSGSTFLFPPSALGGGFQPEDHDQLFEANTAYTHRFGGDKQWFTTLQAEYGTGYPVQFQNGPARLPNHTTVDFSLGKDPGKGANRSLGFDLDIQNLLNHQYVIKMANGFNTTQISSGRNILFRLTAPL
ncbi:MAG: TonB-dependent receptor [Candidatus Eremiobacteraeota bacterium]|nr:TonB-dependent receptor [Candidatus Eremiobacteraeota bacterium]